MDLKYINIFHTNFTHQLFFFPPQIKQREKLNLQKEGFKIRCKESDGSMHIDCTCESRPSDVVVRWILLGFLQ